MIGAFSDIVTSSVVIVAGHYGVGKTNFVLNMALDAAGQDVRVAIIDLDVVNPYFRSSDYRDLLKDAHIELTAPVFAGTNIDGPSLSGAIEPKIEAFQNAEPFHQLLIIDAGGDEVGATVLGRYAATFSQASFDLLYVVNGCRNLTQLPAEAARVLTEIEHRSHLRATALVNNTHLQDETTLEIIQQGRVFAKKTAQALSLPLACTTINKDFLNVNVENRKKVFKLVAEEEVFYLVQRWVKTPWQ